MLNYTVELNIWCQNCESRAWYRKKNGMYTAALYPMNSNIEFIAPEYIFTEISKHADLIEKKAKLSSDDLRYVMDAQCEKGYGGGTK